MTLHLVNKRFYDDISKNCLVIWGESPVVPTLFTLRRKRKTPDWLSSYNTTGLADLCADFDANEEDKVDFESESSCWSDSSTDDSIEDESDDDNLGLDFFPIFYVIFYFKSQCVYCIINQSQWKLYHCLANSISCIFIPDMWVFELWYTFYLIIENSNAKNISIGWKLILTNGVHFWTKKLFTKELIMYLSFQKEIKNSLL